MSNKMLFIIIFILFISGCSESLSSFESCHRQCIDYQCTILKLNDGINPKYPISTCCHWYDYKVSSNVCYIGIDNVTKIEGICLSECKGTQ